MKSITTIFEDLKITFLEATKQSNFTNCIIIYFILYVMVILLPIYLYYMSLGESTLTSNQYAYIYFFMYLMALLLCIVLFLNSEQNKMLFFGIFIFIFILIAFLIYYYNNSKNFQNKYSVYFSILFQCIAVLIIIVALALTYKIFENNFRNQTGFIGFLIDFIFYLPCLFVDFIKFIGGELKMTPNIVYILFIIEILLLLAYYYIPRTIRNAIFKNEISILPNSLFLNYEKQIAASDALMPIIAIDPTTNLDVKTPRKNYTISMWIYLNQQTHNMTNDTTTNIFSYGSKNDYKPKVAYYNNTDDVNTKNIYHIVFAGKEQGYTVELNSQKWNHIVFNYQSTSVDLYINGILERTFQFHETPPIYYPTDVVTIGQNNGLDGAICNICYYTEPLSNYQIVNIYNLLSQLNPPLQ